MVLRFCHQINKDEVFGTHSPDQGAHLRLDRRALPRPATSNANNGEACAVPAQQQFRADSCANHADEVFGTHGRNVEFVGSVGG
jgi:hypothetical protein